jgi:hypothetical protein
MMSADLSGTKKLKYQIYKMAQMFPDEVDAIVLEVALVDVETFAKKEADIPVDSGRLRASIHTKFNRKVNPHMNTSKARLKRNEAKYEGAMPDSQKTYEYYVPAQFDENGNQIEPAKTYDGTLQTPTTWNSVVVGTNVEYAKKINREGGGGPNSRSKNPKGTGQGFFDKAVINGRQKLIRQMGYLVKNMNKLAQKAKPTGGTP